MKIKERHNKAEEIITRYLGDTASHEEILWLEQWVKESDENSRFFLQCKKSWNLSAFTKENLPDVEEEWKIFARENLMEKEVKIRPIASKKAFTITSIAAAVLLLIAGAIWLFSGQSKAVQNFRSVDLVSIEKLSDGSTVSLNRYSHLSFENANIRKAKLDGDAYFEVEKDKDHPFVVFVEDLEVKVLGTSFYVDARDGKQDIQVLVSTGRVSVKAANDSLILKAGEKAIFNRTAKLLKREAIVDQNFLSWKTMNLNFDDTELWQVVQTLNDTYDSQIELSSEKIQSCKITFQFTQHSRAAVLTIISETLDLHIEQKGSRYILSGNSCDQLN